MAILRSTARSAVLKPRSSQSSFRDDVLTGLRRIPKEISPKYFYDERGSVLFDRICDLPEYYLTRTELAIMRESAGAMAEALGPECLLVEYGSGSGIKTPILLEQLTNPAGYVPVEISREHLYLSANALSRRFPELEIAPVCADFTRPFELPRVNRRVRRIAVYFPGSTIGNFTPDEAVRLMKDMARLVGKGGALLLGVDLHKSAEIIEPAYNDAAGVTAAFNMNLLVRINRELAGDFDLQSFKHHAFFNAEQSRIEMHLVSQKTQTVRIGSAVIPFNEGETIRTEYSHKYCRDHFAYLARQAGFEMRQIWMDGKQLFSVQYLVSV